MYSFRGNINGTVDSASQALPMVIENFALVNKAAAAIGVNVYMIRNSVLTSIVPLNLQLAAGEMYESERNVCMLATETIRVQTSGSCDYDFTISNSEP